MNSSKLTVNVDMRSRSSSYPRSAEGKVMEGMLDGGCDEARRCWASKDIVLARTRGI